MVDNLLQASAINEAGQQYEYVPFANPRDIRLLQIPTQDQSTRIEGNIAVVSLDNLPTNSAYQALSYCWGSPAIVDKVWLSKDRYLGITQSVLDILQHFIKEGKRQYLWIDAVCISQSDKKEKGSQIRLMPDIYTFADEVIAWLGPPSLDSDLAMEFITFFSDAMKTHSIGSRGVDGNESKFRQLISGTKFESSELDCIYNFFDRPWFHRIWIVQEMVLSRRTIMVCGEMTAAWEAMDALLESLPSRYLHKIVGGEATTLSLGIRNFDMTFTLSTRHNEKDRMPLQELMLWCRRFYATDPRDKLYALLGIATDSSDRVLDPDYESSPPTIFTNMSRHLMIRDDYLDLLHAAGIGIRRVTAGLPSWVADWATEIGGAGANFGAVSVAAGYKASGSQKAAARPGPDPTSLILKGSLVDTITGVYGHFPIGPLPSGSEELRRSTSAQLDWFKTTEQLVKSFEPYPTGQAWEDVLYSSLTANMLGETCSRPSPEYRQDYQDYLAFLRARQNHTHQDLSDAQQKGALRFHTSLSNVGPRVLFTTAKGYIGRGPKLNVSSGDAVCIIFGSDTPFIIRKNADRGLVGKEDQTLAAHVTYTLIGESYVHGLMDGEGVEQGSPQDFIFV